MVSVVKLVRKVGVVIAFACAFVGILILRNMDAITDIPPGGAWYRTLCKRDGVSNVSVGTAPVSPTELSWLATRTDRMPTLDELKAVREALGNAVDAFNARQLASRGGSLSEDESLQWELTKPSILGLGGSRDEKLIFQREWFAERSSLLAELLVELQKVLRDGHPQWRVRYAARTRSIVIYPDKIYVGQEEAQESTLVSLLTAWTREPGDW